MSDAPWKESGKTILVERPDGSFELAEGVTEAEALAFCVKVIQGFRDREVSEALFAQARAHAFNRPHIVH